MRERECFDILCNSGDGVFIVDENQQIIRWNKGAERIFGYPESEALDRACHQLIGGKSSSGTALCRPDCRIHEGVKSGPRRNFDMLSQTKDGEPIWINTIIISPPNVSDPFLAHVVRDVTAEKKAGLALEQFLADVGNRRLPRRFPAEEKSAGMDSPGAPRRIQDKPMPALSKRELEVLTLVAEGLSTQSLAQRLDISHFTARNHVQNILVKLNLHSKAQAVSYAFKKGIL
jgi:PAS domain S-box-containing protein